MPSVAETALRRTFPEHDWSAAPSSGHADRVVYRLDGRHRLYVKIALVTGATDPGSSPLAEVDRLVWLAGQGIGCPEIVDAGTIDEHEYLVTRAVPGVPAAESWSAADRGRVVDGLADFARHLHALPVDTCPFDRRLKVTIPMAQESAALGELDRSGLPTHMRGWPVPRLITELIAAAKRVGREEPVVCHGDYRLSNVLIDPGTHRVGAVVDVGRLGVADRYTDLALLSRSMTGPGSHPRFGVGDADRLMYRYGEQPVDTDRIALYRLLDEFF